MGFYNQYSRLTEQQYAAIGRVAVHWSIVETTLEDILARLAYAPEYFGRALTNDLAVDNRLGALRRLCLVHDVQLGNRIVSEKSTAALRSLATEIAKHKDLRNKIVHSIWFREDDELMFGTKLRTAPAKPDKEGETHLKRSFHKLNDFARMIEDLAARMEAECQKLPKIEWP